MSSHARWWLCGDHRPIARLIPTESDFPWHYFRLHPLPQYVRYGSLFAYEWDLCRYAFDEFAGTLQYTVALKLRAYIRDHTYVLCGGRCSYGRWHGYYAHSDGKDIWFKYGKWDDPV